MISGEYLTEKIELEDDFQWIVAFEIMKYVKSHFENPGLISIAQKITKRYAGHTVETQDFASH